jgi:hypothetical protein
VPDRVAWVVAWAVLCPSGREAALVNARTSPWLLAKACAFWHAQKVRRCHAQHMACRARPAAAVTLLAAQSALAGRWCFQAGLHAACILLPWRQEGRWCAPAAVPLLQCSAVQRMEPVARHAVF